jgi:hypothetical protein
MSGSWLDALLGPPNISVGGSAATQRPGLNFIAGANVTISSADNPTAERTDVTIAASGSGATSDFTSITTSIATGATWTATSTGVTCATSKTTYIEADFVIKRGSGASAYFKRTVAVQYVSSAHAFVAYGTSPCPGNTIAEELDETGFDVRFAITGPVVTFEAMAPAAGSFVVRYRKVEL